MMRASSSKGPELSPKGSLTRKLLSECQRIGFSAEKLSSPDDNFMETIAIDSSVAELHLEIGTYTSPPSPYLVRTCATDAVAKLLSEEPLFSSPRTPPTTGRKSFDSSPQSPHRGVNLGKKLCRDYISIENIGHGDFGTVWKAYHLMERRFYAVKQFSRKFRGETDRQRRLQEVYALSACAGTCPYIVRYYESWTEGSVLFIKMEYCEGGSVRRAFPVGAYQWSELELWELIYQIGLALHSLHVRNIAHLDVKFENVYIKHDGKKRTYKLGDFGLVRFASTECHSPSFMGTGESDHSEIIWRGVSNDDEGDKRYLCPRFLSTNQYLKPADVYAFGVNLRAAATGIESPNSKPSLDEKMAPHLSSEIRSLICSMCDLDPLHRPTAYDLVLHAATQLEGLTENEMASVKQILSQRRAPRVNCAPPGNHI